MRSCHNLSAGFDDPNLVSCAGLIPVMTLAERAGLHDLARAHVRVPGSAGSNADVKVGALVAGMVAGADTIEATYGYAKQGAGYGYSKVKGLNALLAIISTPLSAPLIAATRLRKGSTYSPKGASRLVADALATVKRAGATGLITVRADSAYYIHD